MVWDLGFGVWDQGFWVEGSGVKCWGVPAERTAARDRAQNLI